MGGLHGQCKEWLSSTLFNIHENTHSGALGTQLITCHQRKLTRPHELQRPAFHWSISWQLAQARPSWHISDRYSHRQSLGFDPWSPVCTVLPVFGQASDAEICPPVDPESVPSLILDLLPASGWIFSTLDHPLGLECQDSKHCRTNQPKVLHLKTTHSQKYELRTVAIPT